MPQTLQLKQPGRNFHFWEKFGIPSPSFHGHSDEMSVKNALALKGFIGLAGNDWNEFRTGRMSPHRKGNGGSWFTPDGGSREVVGHWKKGGCVTRCYNSRSPLRKAAQAQIAKIPFPLAQHIARVFKSQVRVEVPA